MYYLYDALTVYIKKYFFCLYCIYIYMYKKLWGDKYCT